MIDYRPGVQVDHDMRHYQFSRNSGLPRGAFDKKIDVDGIVFVVCVIAITVALVIANIFEIAK